MATCKKNTQYKSSCFICLIVGFVLSLLMGSVGAAEKITYYHNDALGSPVAATDEAGNLLWREAYQPYGDRLLKQGDATNSTWFTGKQEDKAAGLSYFHARWYDPVVGRFTAIDPVDFQEDNIHSFNRYAYANNNPYRYIDTDGRWAEDVVLGIPSLAIGINNLSDNIKQGNYGAATVDTAGIIVDLGAIIAPGVPGGAGLGIKASREGIEKVAKGSSNSRIKKLGPNPNAEGPHTQFKTDPQTGRVTGYTEFDSMGNPVKRFRGQGKSHGGQKPPLILEPKSGKGPGSPPKIARQPRSNELPKGY